MIPFFRKIRKQLLTQNKVSKYLLYAIGEIVLVVIGILIAIQLNNINEQKKSEKKGTQILSKIKQELEQDIIYFDSLSSEYDKWYLETKYILDTVLSGATNELKTLGQYSIGRSSMYFLHINKNSFNESMNSGNSIEIRNRELQNNIVTYFQFAEIELYKLNVDNERFNNWLYIHTDATTWHRLWAKHNLEYEDWSWLKNPSSKIYRDLEGKILFFQNAIGANQTVIKTIKAESKSLIRDIEDELRK